ncbi:MAG TPA: helix-turn-helix domain-containing protein [Candidatus Acidoferrum sp.]|nr:helix-turn-helix domain-containing protein [Candidatus Acidoferrum sp.]
MSEQEMLLQQIDRLVASHALHGSESLCKLLRYLAKHAVEHPGTPIKEFQIATEVFGRSSDFDPQLDSMVRVQAGRLRSKLADYYNSDGLGDPVVVELPKGTYLLSFHHRNSSASKSLGNTQNGIVRTESLEKSTERRWGTEVISLSIFLAAAILVIVWLLATRNSPPVSLASQSEPVPAAFRVFWKGFTSGPDEPWVVFSNAAFVGRPETGMRYRDAKRDAGAPILDHYTGVGEVLAVHQLDGVFALLHHRIRVKRGSLFSLDDGKNNNLIFIGSPSENLSLLEMPGTQEFVFQRLTSGPRKGDQAIINVHPLPDEAKEFLATPSGLPLTEDYAVLGLVRGMTQGQYVLILAGTTTIGTQAAVEYVCRQSSVEELLLRLSVSQDGELKPFEAVIRVKVARGVPVETELVAIRKTAT